jgi:hypothetical protein
VTFLSTVRYLLEHAVITIRITQLVHGYCIPHPPQESCTYLRAHERTPTEYNTVHTRVTSPRVPEIVRRLKTHGKGWGSGAIHYRGLLWRFGEVSMGIARRKPRYLRSSFRTVLVCTCTIVTFWLLAFAQPLYWTLNRTSTLPAVRNDECPVDLQSKNWGYYYKGHLIRSRLQPDMHLAS